MSDFIYLRSQEQISYICMLVVKHKDEMKILFQKFGINSCSPGHICILGMVANNTIFAKLIVHISVRNLNCLKILEE